MASTFISFLGYLILATSVEKSVGAGYFALFLVVGGNFSLFPLVMCVSMLMGLESADGGSATSIL